MKKEIDKWQIHFYLGRALEFFKGYRISFGILKIKTMPKRGELLSKEHYKGFLFSRYFLTK